LESREVIQVSGDFRTTDNTGFDRQSLLVCEWMCEAMVKNSCTVLLINTQHPSTILHTVEQHLVKRLTTLRGSSGDSKASGQKAREVLKKSLRVVSTFDNQEFDLALLNVPFLLAADRKIGMVVVDNLVCGYQDEKLFRGGITFTKFSNERINSIVQAIAGCKVCLVYIKRALFPNKQVQQWNPRISFTVDLNWKEGITNEVEAVLETSNQKLSTTIDIGKSLF